ncbi:MAG: GNAT family N-acetyltransferase [Gemmatimonadaceae bacterium]
MNRSPSDLDHLTIREFASLDEYQACVAFQEATWGQGFSERVPGAILHVGQEIGGVSAGAFEPTGRMVGFVFGLTGVRDGHLVHWSDMLAVLPEYRNRHLGERLKHYQADRVRALGVHTMLWTYDPLVARNAHFNINRLRAYPAAYRPDMYGSNTGSTLHGSLPTDRFVIAWDLDRATALGVGVDAAAPDDDRLPLLNPLNPTGKPCLVAADGQDTVRIQVPLDSHKVQLASQDLAAAWRYNVRELVMPLLVAGYQVSRFVRAHGDALPYYVFTRNPALFPLPNS